MSFGKPSERLRFAVDQEAAEFHGVEQQAIYDTIGALIGGVKVGYSQRGEGTKPIDISVALPRSERTLGEKILSTPLPAGGTARQGANVELGDVVKVVREPASYPIFRHNGRFAEMVTADVAGRLEAPVYGMLSVEDAIGKAGLGQGRPADDQVPRPAARRFEADAALGRRMGGDLRHVPRHGRGVRGGDPRHLPAGRRAVRLVPAAARDPRAGAPDPDRHRDRALAVQRRLHRDLDDRLHRARRHHRAQLDPARRLHPPQAGGGRHSAEARR